jgi:hypothetical protein
VLLLQRGQSSLQGLPADLVGLFRVCGFELYRQRQESAKGIRLQVAFNVGEYFSIGLAFAVNLVYL